MGGYGVFLSTSLALPKSDEHPPLLIYGAPFFLTPGLHPVWILDCSIILQRWKYKPVAAAPRVAGEVFCHKRLHRDLFACSRGKPTSCTIGPVDTGERHRHRGVVRIRWATAFLGISEPVLISGMRSGSRQVREWIPLDRVPPTLIRTLLIIEDRRFFSHFGVDPIAIGRALWVNMTRGVVVQGGSTLTQQLAKNLYYSPKRTIGRKLREVMAAMALEFKYRKEEILESYLNEIYLGQAGPVSIYGVGEAAHRYFSKNLDELSIDETALIVGLIKGPNAYSPVKNVEDATKRRNVVLRRLKEEGILTEGGHDSSHEPAGEGHAESRCPHRCAVLCRSLAQRHRARDRNGHTGRRANLFDP